jgi:hypothetical protein
MSRKKTEAVPLAAALDEWRAQLEAIGRKAKGGDDRPLPSRAKVTSGYPRLSSSMGVHRKQIAQAKARDAELGVPTEYSPDGRPEFRTRGHQKAWLRAHGMVNHDGGFGD